MPGAAADIAPTHAPCGPRLSMQLAMTMLTNWALHFRPAGNFANTLVILLLLAMQGATGELTSGQAELTWRLQFGVGALICVCVTAYRWLYLEESEASNRACGCCFVRARVRAPPGCGAQ